MPSGIEEILPNADPFELKHLREDPAENLLFHVARGSLFFASTILGSRQDLAVDLSVGGQRKFFKFHDRCERHILRQALTHVFAQSTGLRPNRLVMANHISNQAFVSGLVLAHYNHRLLDGLVLRKHRLNLSQFDSVATNLYLVIDASQVVEVPIGAPAYLVSCPIQAISGPSTKMAGHKTLCGQVRTIHITASHTGAADIKLSGHSDRDERSVLIDHIQAGIGDGLPDGDGAVGAVLRTDFIHATTHYGFSRAIFVDEPGFWCI